MLRCYGSFWIFFLRPLIAFQTHNVVVQIQGNQTEANIIAYKYGYFVIRKVLWLEEQLPKRRIKRKVILNDPKWPKMWYMNSVYGRRASMNIEAAWKAGFTGKNIVVSVIDDGLEKDHPDLRDNYEMLASIDLNGKDDDPQPRYGTATDNKHGTRCAGEVAAAANNSFCAVGVAYNSRIGGIRMLDGEVTDLLEADALSFRYDIIDIYSASWGPDDDGKTVDGPGRLALMALEEGVKKGRNGLGNIYVWASGNGGRENDNCNCDGYTNCIYTISVSSSSESGRVPWYSEACASTLVSTYSSGEIGEGKISTTDINHKCTEYHSGTSASAPIAAGIIALMLEANHNLTWRDVQYILVLSAKPQGLIASDWIRNGAGFLVSHAFGFGVIDASISTTLSKNWKTIPEQHECTYEIVPRMHSKYIIHGGKKIKIEFFADGCRHYHNEVNFIEHVQVITSLSSPRRGEMRIYLTSPSGTNSTLLDSRRHDLSSESFMEWPFMTTHCWGEKAYGKWIIEIHNGYEAFDAAPAVLTELTLVIYGTETVPIRSNSLTRRHIPLHLSQGAFLPSGKLQPFGLRRIRLLKNLWFKNPQPFAREPFKKTNASYRSKNLSF